MTQAMINTVTERVNEMKSNVKIQKIMKKSILILIISSLSLIFCGSPVYGQVVGELQGGVPVITVDQQSLRSTYNTNLLTLSGIDGQFISVSLVISTEAGIDYYLVFNGPVYKSSLPANLGSDGVSIVVIGTMSCTTSACSSEDSGCVPRGNGLSCSPCANKGTCTKTVSSNSMIESM